MTSWELVQALAVSGDCAPQCLFGMASEKTCTCRCGGATHGLALAQIKADGRSDRLAGQFFHSFKDLPCGCHLVAGQGVVVGRVQRGVYLVSRFSFWDGQPIGGSLVDLDAMRAWQFYDSPEAMRHTYEHQGIAAATDRHLDNCGEGS